MTDAEEPSVDESKTVEYQVDDDETVVEAVVHAVGALTNVAPDSGRHRAGETLPPLYETVDPDALARLSASSKAEGRVQVTFSYAGCTVSVVGTDTVMVSERS